MSEDTPGAGFYRLTEMQYSRDRRGLLRLYIYEPSGYHRGGIYFTRRPARGEISVERAKRAVEKAIRQGLEVRITNSGDLLLFHAEHGKVIFPEGDDDFWKDLL